MLRAIQKSFDVIQLNLFPFRYARPMTRFVKRNFEGKLIGAEVGVSGGVNAQNMLTLLPIDKLYLVDPYIEYTQEGLVWDFPKNKEMAHTRLRLFDDKIRWIEATSKESVDVVPDSLDFVYIDGNHDYEFVAEDIKLWYPKVRDGGVIGGHDFCVEHLGVVRAVTEFAKKKKIQINGEEVDWWFVKGETTK